MNGIWERQQKEKLLFVDAIVFVGLLILAFYLRTDNPIGMVWSSSGFYLIIFLNLVCLYVFGTYDFEEEFSRAALLARIAAAVMSAALIILFFNFLLEKRRAGIFGRGVLLGAEASFLVISGILRLGIAHRLMSARVKSRWLILIGKNWLGHMGRDIQARIDAGQYIIKAPPESVDALKYPWTGVVVAAKESELGAPQSQALLQARFKGKNVIGVMRFYELVFKKIPLFALSESELIHSEGFVLFQSPIVVRLKRITDILISLILGITLSPLFLLTAVLVRLSSKGPIIYSQERTGKDGRIFTIFKFRSMRLDAEKNGAQWSQANDPRITPIGKFIRSTRLDELPQLWNVMKGEMSFVGPRPERPEFNDKLAEVIPFYNLRHSVRPGLTGWAQVMYPYGSSVEDSKQKLQFDLFYIKNHNLLLDALIILRTIRVVLFGSGR